MNILEYLVLEDNVTPGLKETLKKIYLKTDNGKTAVIRELDDGNLECKFLNYRRYHAVTRLDNKSYTVLTLSKETGSIIAQNEEFVSEKVESNDDIALEDVKIYRPFKRTTK